MSEDTTKLIDEELKEWQDSLDYVIQKDGIERAKKLLENLDIHAYQQNIRSPYKLNPPSFANSLRKFLSWFSLKVPSKKERA